MGWIPVRLENEPARRAKVAPHPCPSSEILDLIHLTYKENNYEKSLSGEPRARSHARLIGGYRVIQIGLLRRLEMQNNMLQSSLLQRPMLR